MGKYMGKRGFMGLYRGCIRVFVAYRANRGKRLKVTDTAKGV